MAKTEFHGSIETGDAALIAAALREWLGTNALDEKVRLSGVEMVHEDESSYVYCYDSLATGGRPASHLIEGHLQLAPAEARARFVQLVSSLGARGVSSSVDYVEVDEEGEWLGEEETVR